MHSLNLLLLCSLLLGIFACRQKDKKTVIDANLLYRDYRISADESEGVVTGVFQFRLKDLNGNSIALTPPLSIALDGEPLVADSAELSGVYYEVRKPLAAFAGAHVLSFTNSKQQTVLDSFSFTPFALTKELGEEVSLNDLLLHLEGLKEAEPLRVMLTDTAFITDGINLVDTVHKGMLNLGQKLEGKIEPGPLVLELVKEERLPLKGKSRGILSITYTLKKEFVLKANAQP